jgi:hypothetical protein
MAYRHSCRSQKQDQNCTRPPGSDVRTMATETTRTSSRETRHKAVCHCEDEAPQNVSNYCRRLMNTGLTLTVVARGVFQTDRCEWRVRDVFQLKYIELKCPCVLCALNCTHVNMCTALFNRLLRDKSWEGKQLRSIGQVVRETSTL